MTGDSRNDDMEIENGINSRGNLQLRPPMITDVLANEKMI